VVVFSKSRNPYCQEAKERLEFYGVDACVVELDKVEDGTHLYVALEEYSKQISVPNIYIGGVHIGSNDELFESI
jgi:glutaredoxin 3